MDATSQNHLDFAARVARIQSNIAGAQQLLFVGADEVYSMPRRDRKPKVSRLRALMGKLLYPVSIVVAVALGIAAHGVGQVARFYVQGLPDLKANPDTEMLVQMIVGIVVSMFLGFAFGLNTKAFTTLKSVGVVIGILIFHNFVHLWPQQFAALTSEQWVDQVVSTTNGSSILWRGVSFVM